MTSESRDVIDDITILTALEHFPIGFHLPIANIFAIGNSKYIGIIVMMPIRTLGEESFQRRKHF